MRTTLLFLVLASLSLAAGIEITRTVAQNASYGQSIPVIISMTNTGAEENVIVRESVSGLDILEKGPITNQTYFDDYGNAGLVVQFLEWSFVLGPDETKALSYTLRISRVNDITLAPTLVVAESGAYSGEAQTIYVDCVPNGVCETGLGESFRNCEDCTTGIMDGICDLASDGRNDPECAYGADPDYSGTADTDGDGVVDQSDRCALTPSGEKADASGCSCSQKYCLEVCDWSTGECITAKVMNETGMPGGPEPAAFDPMLIVGAVAVMAIIIWLFRRRKAQQAQPP